LRDKTLEMLLDCFFRQNRRGSEHSTTTTTTSDNDAHDRKQLSQRKFIGRNNSIQPAHLSKNTNFENGKQRMDSNQVIESNNNNSVVYDNRSSSTSPSPRFSRENLNRKNLVLGTPNNTPILFFSNGTPRDVKSWSESFENLLDDPVGIQTFFMHLKAEHSTENIRFWLACENYKKSEASTLEETASLIYNEFLSRRASSQINVNCSLLREVRKEMTRPSHTTFLKVQHEIFNLMRTDSYPRFLKSEKYASMLRERPVSS